jgi:DNA-binding GntR family transcriptional regulator
MIRDVPPVRIIPADVDSQSKRDRRYVDVHMLLLTESQTQPEKPDPSLPLAESAYIRLRRLILDCELMPDAPLTETGVAGLLQVGKTPVREAMRRLVQERLLRVRPRSGYSVAPVTAEDIDDVFRLRQLAEGSTASLAAGGLPLPALQRLSALCEIGYQADDRASVLRFLALNAEYHGIIARASGNGRLATLVGHLLDESQRMIHVGILTHGSAIDVRQEHAELLRSLRAGDGASARRQMEQHIENARIMARASLLIQGASSAA